MWLQDIAKHRGEDVNLREFFDALFTTANASSIQALVERLEQRHKYRPADALSDAQRAELREVSRRRCGSGWVVSSDWRPNARLASVEAIFFSA